MIRLTTGNETNPCVRWVHRHGVEVIFQPVLAGHFSANVEDLALDIERMRRDQIPIGMGNEDLAAKFHLWGDGAHPVRIDIDGAGAIRDRGHHLQPRPQPGCPRKRDCVTPKIDGFLHVARREDRDMHPDERRIGRAGQCRRFGCGIVAHQCDHAAVAMHTRE